MQHTYLRYECADTFGLVVGGSVTSSRTPPSCDVMRFLDLGPPSQAQLVFTASGSYIIVWNVKTGLPVYKLAHADTTTGNIGTGMALNNDQVLCLDLHNGDNTEDQERIVKAASGWIDGSVRVFDVPVSDLLSSRSSSNKERNIAPSIFHSTDGDDGIIRADPLTLNGHSSPVSAIHLETLSKSASTSRLASGGSDGSVIVWDLVAETGLYRLLGHSGGITGIQFVQVSYQQDGMLITTSLDGLIKVWDLAGQCCVQTLANHRGPVWAVNLSQFSVGSDKKEISMPDTQRMRLLTGSIDGQIRVWSVTTTSLSSSSASREKTVPAIDMDADSEQPPAPHHEDIDQSDSNPDEVCQDMGPLALPQHVANQMERIASVQCSSRYVAILQASSKVIEVYSIRSRRESMKKKQRRLKRKQEKSRLKEAQADKPKQTKKRGMLDDPDSSADEKEQQQQQQQQNQLDSDAIRATDELEFVTSIRASHKIKGFVFATHDGKAGETLRIICALSTNTVEAYTLKKKDGTLVASKGSDIVNLYGHPTGVRAVALTSNDEIACTISKNVCKLWNVSRRSCVQSLPMEVPAMNKPCQGLCCVFLPGNTHVVVGTREGHLLIIEISSCQIVYFEESAHEGAIWAIDVLHKREEGIVSIVTGSADKKVHFWNVESQEDDEEIENPSRDQPMVVLTRAMEMTDEVVAVRYSNVPSAKRMVFVSALDCTIKVFFEDSLKMFLSLYGHKLPALAVDASDDDMLLGSASADKTIKIWGLDFGDTHRTLHGHGDSVMDLKFVRGTHNFFTCSKDGTVRYWDGDRFEQVLVLRGHSAEVNNLAVSRTGAFCLSGGMDRQVRVWERTKDIVFLDEERERELDQMFDQNQRRDEMDTGDIMKAREGDENDEEAPQSEAAVRQSVLSTAAGDRVLEALELADQELTKQKAKKTKSTTPNPMLLGMEPPQYVLWVLRSIRAAELEQSLLVLSLHHVERLLYYVVVLLRSGQGVELCSKTATFVVKTYHNQLIMMQKLAPLLHELRRLIKLRTGEFRDTIGYNLAALRMISRISQENKASTSVPLETTKNVWEGLGLGSDVAAALQGSYKR